MKKVIDKLLRETKFKSLPLKLPQNSLLNIQSKTRLDQVRLLPQWRDDGHITLKRITINKNEAADVKVDEIDWRVKVKDGKKTGLTTVDVSIDLESNLSQHYAKDVLVAEERIEKEDNDVSSNQEVGTNETIIIAEIPEKCNVNCMLQKGGDIVVEKKLEGEDGFKLFTSGGNITVDKLRGDAIELDSKYMSTGGKGGIIHVKKACEAQELNVSVGKGGRLRAKMLNVSNANVEVEDEEGLEFEKLDEDDGLALIDVSSIYTSQSGEGAHLAVGKANGRDSVKKVRVKSNHGHLSVRTATSFSCNESSMIDEFGQEMSHVELGGVNGSFDVSVEKITGDETFDNSEDSNLPMAAKIHVDSLSPGQASILTSDFGDVGLTLDRKIESDIRLLSSPFVQSVDPNVLLEEDESQLVNALAAHDDYVEELLTGSNQEEDAIHANNPFKISLETEAFSGHRSSDMNHLEYVQGVIENKSLEPNSRFDVKTKGLSSSVGKIRMEGAAGQALHGFSGGNTQEGDTEETGKLDDLPLLAVVTNGRIKVESLSWFGAIARRYGVDSQERDLGRQATAGGKADAIKKK